MREHHVRPGRGRTASHLALLGVLLVVIAVLMRGVREPASTKIAPTPSPRPFHVLEVSLVPAVPIHLSRWNIDGVALRMSGSQVAAATAGRRTKLPTWQYQDYLVVDVIGSSLQCWKEPCLWTGMSGWSLCQQLGPPPELYEENGVTRWIYHDGVDALECVLLSSPSGLALDHVHLWTIDAPRPARSDTGR